MSFELYKNAKIVSEYGDHSRLLVFCLNSICRILPHIETVEWKVNKTDRHKVTWEEHNRTLLIEFRPATRLIGVSFLVRRKKIPSGIGAIARTIDTAEHDICISVIDLTSKLLSNSNSIDSSILRSIEDTFDELVVAEYLKKKHGLDLDPFSIFQQLKRLGAQTYENKTLTFGCIIDSNDNSKPANDAEFPVSYFEFKRYRALSDGYHTAYKLSKKGKLVSFLEIPRLPLHSLHEHNKWFPDWSRDFALYCIDGKIGIWLTRHGDILIFEDGSMRLSYRLGKWQYWNHRHLTDLIKILARAQKVNKKQLQKIINFLYRTSLDISFRRTGGLLVLLRNRSDILEIVREKDLIGAPNRQEAQTAFDLSLGPPEIQRISRQVLVELSSLDGAVILNNNGEMLAYGAVLKVKKYVAEVQKQEGSRSKAAIGASFFGISIKISSDSDISIFYKGKEFIKI